MAVNEGMNPGQVSHVLNIGANADELIRVIDAIEVRLNQLQKNIRTLEKEAQKVTVKAKVVPDKDAIHTITKSTYDVKITAKASPRLYTSLNQIHKSIQRHMDERPIHIRFVTNLDHIEAQLSRIRALSKAPVGTITPEVQRTVASEVAAASATSASARPSSPATGAVYLSDVRAALDAQMNYVERQAERITRRLEQTQDKFTKQALKEELDRLKVQEKLLKLEKDRLDVKRKTLEATEKEQKLIFQAEMHQAKLRDKTLAGDKKLQSIQFAAEEKRRRELERARKEEEKRIKELQRLEQKAEREAARRRIDIVGMPERFAKITSWMSAVWLLFGAVGAMRSAIGTISEMEKGLIGLQKVMDESTTNFKMLRDEALRMAHDYGQGSVDVIGVMQEFAKQGRSQAEILYMTEAAILANNIAEVNLADATRYLNTALLQFNKDASESMAILDSWNEVANRNAVTVVDLAESVAGAGALAHQLGMTLHELNGVTAALTATTGRSGREISNALKFIFTRVPRPNTIAHIEEIGVAARKSQNELRDLTLILEDIAHVFPTLTDFQKQEIAFALGGTRHVNLVISLLENWDLVRKATDESINSFGSAMRENEKFMESYERKVAQLGASFQSLAVSIGNSGLLNILKTIVSGLDAVVSLFNKLPEPVRVATIAVTGFTVAMKLLNAALMQFKVQGAVAAISAATTFVTTTTSAVMTAGSFSAALGVLKTAMITFAGAAKVAAITALGFIKAIAPWALALGGIIYMFKQLTKSQQDYIDEANREVLATAEQDRAIKSQISSLERLKKRIDEINSSGASEIELQRQKNALLREANSIIPGLASNYEELADKIDLALGALDAQSKISGQSFERVIQNLRGMYGRQYSRVKEELERARADSDALLNYMNQPEYANLSQRQQERIYARYQETLKRIRQLEDERERIIVEYQRLRMHSMPDRDDRIYKPEDVADAFDYLKSLREITATYGELTEDLTAVEEAVEGTHDALSRVTNLYRLHWENTGRGLSQYIDLITDAQEKERQLLAYQGQVILGRLTGMASPEELRNLFETYGDFGYNEMRSRFAVPPGTDKWYVYLEEGVKIFEKLNSNVDKHKTLLESAFREGLIDFKTYVTEMRKLEDADPFRKQRESILQMNEALRTGTKGAIREAFRDLFSGQVDAIERIKDRFKNLHAEIMADQVTNWLMSSSYMKRYIDGHSLAFARVLGATDMIPTGLPDIRIHKSPLQEAKDKIDQLDIDAELTNDAVRFTNHQPFWDKLKGILAAAISVGIAKGLYDFFNRRRPPGAGGPPSRRIRPDAEQLELPFDQPALEWETQKVPLPKEELEWETKQVPLPKEDLKWEQTKLPLPNEEIKWEQTKLPLPDGKIEWEQTKLPLPDGKIEWEQTKLPLPDDREIKWEQTKLPLPAVELEWERSLVPLPKRELEWATSTISLPALPPEKVVWSTFEPTLPPIPEDKIQWNLSDIAIKIQGSVPVASENVAIEGLKLSITDPVNVKVLGDIPVNTPVLAKISGVLELAPDQISVSPGVKIDSKPIDTLIGHIEDINTGLGGMAPSISTFRSRVDKLATELGNVSFDPILDMAENLTVSLEVVKYNNSRLAEIAEAFSSLSTTDIGLITTGVGALATLAGLTFAVTGAGAAAGAGAAGGAAIGAAAGGAAAGGAAAGGAAALGLGGPLLWGIIGAGILTGSAVGLWRAGGQSREVRSRLERLANTDPEKLVAELGVAMSEAELIIESAKHLLQAPKQEKSFLGVAADAVKGWFGVRDDQLALAHQIGILEAQLERRYGVPVTDAEKMKQLGIASVALYASRTNQDLADIAEGVRQKEAKRISEAITMLMSEDIQLSILKSIEGAFSASDGVYDNFVESLRFNVENALKQAIINAFMQKAMLNVDLTGIQENINRAIQAKMTDDEVAYKQALSDLSSEVRKTSAAFRDIFDIMEEIRPLTLLSLSSGGYTGDGGVYQPAGIVHKGEYVIPQWMVKSIPGLVVTLEKIRRGKGYIGGGNARGLDIEKYIQDLINQLQATGYDFGFPDLAKYPQKQAERLLGTVRGQGGIIGTIVNFLWSPIMSLISKIMNPGGILGGFGLFDILFKGLGIFGSIFGTLFGSGASGLLSGLTGLGGLSLLPFDTGGYTGRGPALEAAGIVHKGEYVIPKWMVEKFPGYVRMLERIRRRGYNNGGYTFLDLGLDKISIGKGTMKTSTNPSYVLENLEVQRLQLRTLTRQEQLLQELNKAIQGDPEAAGRALAGMLGYDFSNEGQREAFAKMMKENYPYLQSVTPEGIVAAVGAVISDEGMMLTPEAMDRIFRFHADKVVKLLNQIHQEWSEGQRKFREETWNENIKSLEDVFKDPERIKNMVAAYLTGLGTFQDSFAAALHALGVGIDASPLGERISAKLMQHGFGGDLGSVLGGLGSVISSFSQEDPNARARMMMTGVGSIFHGQWWAGLLGPLSMLLFPPAPPKLPEAPAPPERVGLHWRKQVVTPDFFPLPESYYFRDWASSARLDLGVPSVSQDNRIIIQEGAIKIGEGVDSSDAEIIKRHIMEAFDEIAHQYERDRRRVVIM